MFINNIDPILFRLGGLQIKYYGIIYALGFLFTVWYMARLARDKKIPLTVDETYDLMVYVILGVLIGARLFEILFYEPAYYFSNPMQMIAYWNGGLSFHGGLVGAIAGGWIYLKKRKVRFYKIADHMVVPAALALAFGRIANFINGEIYGKITTVPWAVKFNGVDGYRHPTQLYESIGMFFTFGLLYKIRNRKYKDGFMFWLFVALYGGIRFVIEFWKVDENYFLGFPVGQWFSLIMLVVGLIVLYRNYRKK